MPTGQLNGILRHLRRSTQSRDLATLTDGQLLERYRTRRDEMAFEVLMRRHGPMVLGVCRRVLNHPDDAEDAFQATFLVLVRKAASIAQRELVGNWLYGAAYRAALETKAARRQSPGRQVMAMREPEAAAAPKGDDLQPLLDQEISRLPDKYRVPVVLCELEGRTLKEAARQLGIPEGTLSGRLTTARRKLAQRLTRRGLMLSSLGLAATLSHEAAASVPTPLVVSTLQAATAVAAGPATAASVISQPVVALTERVVKSMFLTKLKSLTVAVLTLSVLGGSALTYQTLRAAQNGGKKPVVPATSAATDDKPKDKPDKKGDPPKAAEKPASYLGLLLKDNPKGTGALVHQVFPDSPAAKAGFKENDLVLKVGGASVKDPNATIKAVLALKPGDKVSIHFKRGDKEMDLTVTLGTRPADLKPPGKDEESKDGDKPEERLGLFRFLNGVHS